MANATRFGVRKRTGGINITPFVDVLLVVLVIFILTSNASIPGIKVDLPKASASVALEKPKTKAITIDNAGQVFLDATRSRWPSWRSACAPRRRCRRISR